MQHSTNYTANPQQGSFRSIGRARDPLHAASACMKASAVQRRRVLNFEVGELNVEVGALAPLSTRNLKFAMNGTPKMKGKLIDPRKKLHKDSLQIEIDCRHVKSASCISCVTVEAWVGPEPSDSVPAPRVMESEKWSIVQLLWVALWRIRSESFLLSLKAVNWTEGKSKIFEVLVCRHLFGWL